MRKIASILKDYDLIAVQEISNVREQSDPGCPRNQDACPGDKNCGAIRNALQRHLNAVCGINYEFVFSEQVKDERYLFIYNPAKVTLEKAELVPDPDDSLPICDPTPSSTGKMVRQPYKAKFRAGGFDFVMLTAHTSPEQNLHELEGLEYFFRQAGTEGEPDVILMGDLNADCSYLKEADPIALRGIDRVWLVSDDTDTTVAATHCAYDRIILTPSAVEDFTGRWGIVKDVPPTVSDHYLVWAEFYIDKDTD